MTAWTPILEGALADAARDALRELAEQLGHHPARPEDRVLFWAYAGDAHDDATARYAGAVEELLGSVDERAGMLQLHGGLAGVGWTLAHVGDPDDCEEFLSTLDATLVGALRERWSGDYDLIRGIVGLGIYFLERLAGDRDAPLAREGLLRVVDHLDATARVEPSGAITWRTRPEHVPAWQLAQAPDGYDNCGAAHGVPGAIAMLARAATIASAAPKARALTDGAMRWLEAQRLPESGGFPAWIAPGIAPTPTRSAWCYGDPGVAIVSWNAAARVASPVEPWRALARECTRRPAAGVRDACLCHGAFGLAHVFNRCFQASRDAAFRDAACEWIERGLAMRRVGEGVAGFLKFQPELEPDPWIATDAFLDGAAGIGLALATALGDVEPAWDRLLACDLPC
jgi:hypothetical protein